MNLRTCNRISAFVVIIIVCASINGCIEPNAVAQYARQLELPKQTRELTEILGLDGMDNNEKALLDQLYCLPEDLREHEQTSQYLIRVCADSTVNDDEARGLSELDHDQDTLTYQQETELGTNPLSANPNVVQVLSSPITSNYLRQLETDTHRDLVKQTSDKEYIEKERKLVVDTFYSECIEPVKFWNEDGMQNLDEEAAVLLIIEILGSNMTHIAKKSNVSYLALHPSKFVDVHETLRTISPSSVDVFMDFTIDDSVVEYLLFISDSYENSKIDLAFADEVLKNKLCIQDRQLTELERDFISNPDRFMRSLLNEYLTEMEITNPELSLEISKLPDMHRMDLKDLEAVEDILDLARSDSVFGTTFKSILDEGIKDKRAYCSPLEALLWLMYDYEGECADRGQMVSEGQDRLKFPHVHDGTPAKSPERDPYVTTLTLFSWYESTTSNRFQSDKWQHIHDVADRLNSLDLIGLFPIEYELHGQRQVQTLETTFRNRTGDCDDMASFRNYCLQKNGYPGVLNSNARIAVCGLSFLFDPPIEEGSRVSHGHAFVLVRIDNSFYTIDTGGGFSKSSYVSIEEILDSYCERFSENRFRLPEGTGNTVEAISWSSYTLHDIRWVPIKTVPKE